MRIISRKRIRTWAEEYPDARNALVRWWTVAEEAEWNSMQEIRRAFPTADAVLVKSGRIATVFNIRGNTYRLITAVHYNTQRIFMLNFFTHADYDNVDWKGAL